MKQENQFPNAVKSHVPMITRRLVRLQNLHAKGKGKGWMLQHKPGRQAGRPNRVQTRQTQPKC